MFNFSNIQNFFFKIVSSNINKIYFYRLINYVLNKIKIKEKILFLIFKKKKLTFNNKYSVENKIFVVDHLYYKKLFFFHLIFKHQIYNNNCKIISIPAGLPLYVKHPKEWDKAKNEISIISNKYDKVGIQHQYWLDELKIIPKFNSKRAKILGSPRYTKEWINELDSFTPMDNQPLDFTGVKIVYMAANSTDHINFHEKKKETIEMVSNLPNVKLIYKPHPRSNLKYTIFPKNVINGKNYLSTNLINWADIIIGEISAIMIEVILKKKIYISLKYLRNQDTEMIYERYKCCEIANSINDLKSQILNLKNYDYSSKKTSIEKFYKDIVLNNSKDLLEEYSNFINE